MRLISLSLLAVLLATSGCTKRIVQPPPAAFVQLGGLKAGYRDWSNLPDVCLVDPAVLQSDVDAMSAVLSEYLAQTAGGVDGTWSPAQLETLEKGEQVLPVALSLEANAIELSKKSACPFTGFDKAMDLNKKAADRVASLKGLAGVLRSKAALARWREALPSATADAKTKVCDAKPKAPAVYFASEDEKGKAEWLFCDGAKVTAAPGSPPALTTQPEVAAAPAPPPPAKKKGKKAPPPPPAPAAVDAKAYVDAAAAYPSSDVSHAPKVQSMVPKKKDDGAAEPKDG